MALLIQALERALTQKPRPSLVYVWSAPPESSVPALQTSIRKLLRRGITVRWVAAPAACGRRPAEEVSAAAEAVAQRRAQRGERLLLAMGGGTAARTPPPE
jgi:hypothetical protein